MFCCLTTKMVSVFQHLFELAPSSPLHAMPRPPTSSVTGGFPEFPDLTAYLGDVMLCLTLARKSAALCQIQRHDPHR